MTLLASFLGFPLEYTLACTAYLMPLRKKPHWILRALAVTAAHIIMNYLLLRFIERTGVPRPVAFFASFLMGVLFFYSCTEGSFWDAVYGSCYGYATQHLSYVIVDIILELFPGAQRHISVITAVILSVIILCCYILVSRKLPVLGEYRVDRQTAFQSLILVIPFAFFLSMLAAQFYDEGKGLALYLICRTYAACCCIFALGVQTIINEKISIEAEYRTRQRLWEKQREQYQLSKENIDIINRKCHDLKYQVAALRTELNERKRSESLDAIESAVMIYDSAVSTGNEVLDTILTERSLCCEAEHITWTCVADGSKLGHINPVDLYILFGNILDNAIESVRKLTDPEQKVVSMNLYTRSNMAVIQVENYYSGNIQLEHGLPRTTKEDASNHGFGMQSVKSIVEKYGGSLSVDTDHQIFLLSILLPLQI